MKYLLINRNKQTVTRYINRADMLANAAELMAGNPDARIELFQSNSAADVAELIAIYQGDGFTLETDSEKEWQDLRQYAADIGSDWRDYFTAEEAAFFTEYHK